jgi:hypothetical protein
LTAVADLGFDTDAASAYRSGHAERSDFRLLPQGEDPSADPKCTQDDFTRKPGSVTSQRLNFPMLRAKVMEVVVK